MKERNELIRAFKNSEEAKKKIAMVTVVHLEGSSYRRPGARMIVDEGGMMTGAISGGCLEGDALRKSLLVIMQDKPKVVTYDTFDEDDQSIGVQLGCEGIIQVLFEPIDSKSDLHPIKLLQQIEAKRQHNVLVTLFDLHEKDKDQIGTCMLITEDHTITGNTPIKELEKEIIEHGKDVLTAKKSDFITYSFQGRKITAFYEFTRPAVSLVIVGAGNDAIPLAKMADIIGWQVSIVDGRYTHANPERFEASCTVLVSKPENVLEKIDIDNQTVFVLMTHNYNYDLAMLQALLTKPTPYIGVLGPKKKLDKMLQEIKEKGVAIHDEQLQKIHGPAGIEIGSETAEEIALSIVAEVKAVLNKKQAGFLKDKEGSIHSRRDTQMKYKHL